MAVGAIPTNTITRTSKITAVFVLVPSRCDNNDHYLKCFDQSVRLSPCSCHLVYPSLLQLAVLQAVFDVLLDGSILVSYLLSYVLSVSLSSPPDLFDLLLCRHASSSDELAGQDDHEQRHEQIPKYCFYHR